MERKLVAVGGLSTSITNYALSNDLSFPNVTIENWETVAVQTRIQADGIVVEWMPLVTDETREGWEEYAENHKSWQDEMFQAETEFKAVQDEYFGLEPREVQNQAPGGSPPGAEGQGQGQMSPSSGQEGQGTPPEMDGQEQGPPPGQAPPQRALQQGQGSELGGPPQEGVQPQQQGPGEGGPTPFLKYSREIFGLGDGGGIGQVMPPGTGPYAPMWQVSLSI